MSEKDLNTEQKILLAAKKVFIQKGMEGTRMQEIADEAGINKALLHYYFRSKEKLFEGVFKEAFVSLLPQIISLLKQDIPLFDKIRQFTEQYIDLFIENPFIPRFVIHELNRNPQLIVKLISNTGIEPDHFIAQVKQEVELGNIIEISPQHLIVNMLSMSIFPFVATPIIRNLIFREDNEAFRNFIEERKKTVPEFIINSIRKHE